MARVITDPRGKIMKTTLFNKLSHRIDLTRHTGSHLNTINTHTHTHSLV